MLLLNKHNFAVADFASKDNSRYTLNAIQVTPTETVATDGHILGVVTVPTEARADNFPSIPGFKPNGHKPFLLETGNAQKIRKAIPKKERIPILNNAAVSVDDEGNAELAITNLETAQVFRQKKIPGNFPNWPAVFENLGEPAVRICFNAHLLLRLAKAVVDFTGEDAAPVILSIKDNAHGIAFEAKNSETGQTLRGVVMPQRM